MTDTSAPEAEAPDAETSRIAAAQERFDQMVSGVMAIAPSENVNASMLQGAIRAVKAALFAVLVEPEAPSAEPPRDETHHSVDPATGTLTGDAAATQGQMAAAGIDPHAPDAASQLAAAQTPAEAAADPTEPATSPAA